jgi:hypothetical protein
LNRAIREEGERLRKTFPEIDFDRPGPRHSRSRALGSIASGATDSAGNIGDEAVPRRNSGCGLTGTIAPAPVPVFERSTVGGFSPAFQHPAKAGDKVNAVRYSRLEVIGKEPFRREDLGCCRRCWSTSAPMSGRPPDGSRTAVFTAFRERQVRLPPLGIFKWGGLFNTLTGCWWMAIGFVTAYSQGGMSPTFTGCGSLSPRYCLRRAARRR